MSKLLTTFLALTLLCGCSAAQPEPSVEPVENSVYNSTEPRTFPEVTSRLNEDGTYSIYVMQGPKEVAIIDKEVPVDGYNTYLFDEVGDAAYVAVDPTGLGGYVLYSGAFELYSVNLSTGAVEQINYDGWATDISDDGSKLASVATSEEGRIVQVTDLISGEQVTYEVDAAFDQAGDATFNFDGSKLAYQATITTNEPNNEETTVFVVDLATGEQTEFARKDGLYEIMWQDNDRPIVE